MRSPHTDRHTLIAGVIAVVLGAILVALMCCGVQAQAWDGFLEGPAGRHVVWAEPILHGPWKNMGRYHTTNSRRAWAQWIPQIPQDGRYRVMVEVFAVGRVTDAVPYTVYAPDRPSTSYVSQEGRGMRWAPIGHWRFNAGDSASITLTPCRWHRQRMSAARVRLVPE